MQHLVVEHEYDIIMKAVQLPHVFHQQFKAVFNQEKRLLTLFHAILIDFSHHVPLNQG